MKPDVLIVGASVAGLACGKRLAECGVPFQILEAAGAAGGRYRTDQLEGFRLDRTFPWYLPAFPEGRRVLDLDSLELQPFARAVLVRFAGKFHRVADPRFEPCSAGTSLFHPVGTPRDKLRMVRLFWEIDRGKMDRQLEKDERLALDLLRWNGGFSTAMIDRFFRPLAGMFFLDRRLATSSRLFRFLFRLLAEGGLAVPARGLQAIPDQIAAGLPPGSLRLKAKVEGVGHREVALADGEVARARAIAIATDAPTSARLIGETATSVDRREGLLLHYAAVNPPVDEPIVLLDGEGTGPVNNLAVLTNLSPAFAPMGEALIAAGVVGASDEDREELDRRVRLQMAEWFGAAASGWRLLRIIPTAVPDQTAGKLEPWQRPVRLHPGLYVCGRERDNATTDGALTSGFRAAQAIMEDLHASRT